MFHFTVACVGNVVGSKINFHLTVFVYAPSFASVVCVLMLTSYVHGYVVLSSSIFFFINGAIFGGGSDGEGWLLCGFLLPYLRPLGLLY